LDTDVSRGEAVLESFLLWNERQNEAFTKQYMVLFVDIASAEQKKIFLGEGEAKICRYCGDDPTRTTFKEVSHAIPIFLGNKTIIDLLECDRCNHHFGDHLENSFANYTHPFRPLQRTRGRSGVPVYKDKNLRVSAKGYSHLEIWAHGDLGLEDLKVDGKNQLKLPMQRLPYYPTAIHKSLIKIALALTPAEDHSRFGDIKRWLLEKNHHPGVIGFGPVMEWIINGPTSPDHIRCIIARAKEHARDTVFEYQLVLRFGNFQYQLTIPLSEEAGKEKSFVRAPLLMPDEHFRAFGLSNFEDKNFESGERVANEEVFLGLKFEKAGEATG
jgi:hypothetical protein